MEGEKLLELGHDITSCMTGDNSGRMLSNIPCVWMHLASSECQSGMSWDKCRMNLGTGMRWIAVCKQASYMTANVDGHEGWCARTGLI